MNYRKAHILVEGQTEERFVKEILASAMPKGLFLNPVVIANKRVASGGKFKGGVPSYPKVRAEILRLLSDTSAVKVTTMLDFYALPETFPKYHDIPKSAAGLEKVVLLENALNADIDNPRFRAYLSLHEFEALLFSQPEAIADRLGQPELTKQLLDIRSAFSSPEEIDGGSATAPSSRLQALYPRYNKPLFGTLISQRIGIQTMLKSCPHFAQWVAFLQTL
jgi:hypothetical protein